MTIQAGVKRTMERKNKINIKNKINVIVGVFSLETSANRRRRLYWFTKYTSTRYTIHTQDRHCTQNMYEHTNKQTHTQVCGRICFLKSKRLKWERWLAESVGLGGVGASQFELFRCLCRGIRDRGTSPNAWCGVCFKSRTFAHPCIYIYMHLYLHACLLFAWWSLLKVLTWETAEAEFVNGCNAMLGPQKLWVKSWSFRPIEMDFALDTFLAARLRVG